jgi:predicted  nucleic acid-binding Zn-ribbon protein
VVPDLAHLLDIQDRDVALDQLRHRRQTLPERAALSDGRAGLARVDRELATLGQQVHELEVTQRRLEDEVATVETKAAAESKKLNSGTITAPRELQALSEEVDSLGRRKRSLEDELLEVMEKAEPLVADVDRLTGERTGLAAEVERLQAVIGDREREIDAEIAEVIAARANAASSIPDDLLARYEKLRAKLGGVAVARLDGDRCTGCHVSLPAMEVDAARHAPTDAVIIHEDCGRILVR